MPPACATRDNFTRIAEVLRVMISDPIMQLVYGWTIVGAFVFTVVLTCLSLAGWIRFADKRQQKRLFGALLLPLVLGLAAKQADWVSFDPSDIQRDLSDFAVRTFRDVAASADGGVEVDVGDRELRALPRLARYLVKHSREEQRKIATFSADILRLRAKSEPTQELRKNLGKALRLDSR